MISILKTKGIQWLILFSFLLPSGVFAQSKFLNAQLFFEKDKFVLNAQSESMLQHICDTVKTFQKFRIVLTGNAD